MAIAPNNGNILHYLCTCVLFYCFALFQVPTVDCQSYGSVGIPTSMLPFCVNFPRAFGSGQQIKITGSFEQSGSPWLNIILRERCSSNESPFYLKIGFYYNTNAILLTSLENGKLGDDEIEDSFPFSRGTSFVLLIEVHPDGYKVTANGVPLRTLAHRLRNVDVRVSEATGEKVNINRVELINVADKDQPGNGQIIYPVPLGSGPVFQPSFPFWGTFPEGLKAGKSIRIEGFFPTEFIRTTINLCPNCFKSPVMLHLDIRFNSEIKPSVTRRSLLRSEWQYTERDGPIFPFRLREQFTLIIHVQQENYSIEVNDVHCWTFKHRYPFTEVKEITIERSFMNISKIEYFDTHSENKDMSEVLTSDSTSVGITTSIDSRICHIPVHSIFLVSLIWVLLLM